MQPRWAIERRAARLVLITVFSEAAAAQILDEMPDLGAEDRKACLIFACRRSDHPLLAA